PGTGAKVAQLVEHSTENAGVAGSIPALGTFSCFWEIATSLKPFLTRSQACRVFSRYRSVQQPPQAGTAPPPSSSSSSPPFHPLFYYKQGLSRYSLFLRV